jgi:hypothetical protein
MLQSPLDWTVGGCTLIGERVPIGLYCLIDTGAPCSAGLVLVCRPSTMVAGASSHPSFWAVLAATFDRGSTNHQQGVTTVWCWCPGCGPLKRSIQWAPSPMSSGGEAWVVGGFQYVSLGWCAGCPLIMQISSFHTVCRSLSGDQPHWCCGKGVFFD